MMPSKMPKYDSQHFALMTDNCNSLRLSLKHRIHMNGVKITQTGERISLFPLLQGTQFQTRYAVLQSHD